MWSQVMQGIGTLGQEKGIGDRIQFSFITTTLLILM